MEYFLPRPDDWHVHLRQGKPMRAYVRTHALGFGRILAMPNTLPPLVSPDQIAEYCQLAQRAAPRLQVLVAFRIMPETTPRQVEALAAAGVPAGKYYPDGVTTNSTGGITDWQQIREAIKAMEECGMVLCIHGETPEAEVLAREQAFLPTFKEIRQEFPGLKMVLEHVSSAEGVAMVLEDPGPSAATVTVQHLMFNLDHLLGGHLNPHLFCKPVLKPKSHQQAIEKVVMSGHPRFFFGSDSAPHDIALKHSDSCPAGAYTAPMILPALATFFEKAGNLPGLKPFLCDFGREFYGMPENKGRVKLLRKAWRVPDQADGSIPLMAGEVLDWQLASE